MEVDVAVAPIPGYHEQARMMNLSPRNAAVINYNNGNKGIYFEGKINMGGQECGYAGSIPIEKIANRAELLTAVPPITNDIVTGTSENNTDNLEKKHNTDNENENDNINNRHSESDNNLNTDNKNENNSINESNTDSMVVDESGTEKTSHESGTEKTSHKRTLPTTTTPSKKLIRNNPAIQTTSPISNNDTKESTEALIIPQSTLRIPPTATNIRQLVADFDEITFPIPSHDLVHMKLELSRVMKSDDHTGIQVFFNYSRLRKWVDNYSAVNQERRQNLFVVYTRTFDNIIQHSKQSHEDERLVDL